MKRHVEFKFSEWFGLTQEQRDRWHDHIQMQKMQLVLVDDKFDEPPREFQLDRDEFIADMSLGGKRYRERR